MSAPGGVDLVRQVTEVHQQMLRLASAGTDPEADHDEADNALTRLVTLMAYNHPSPDVCRRAHLIVRAWGRVRKYYA